MQRLLKIALLLIVSASLLTSCEEKAQVLTPALSDYMPLEVGKYIRYRCDSTVFVNFGTKDTVKSYQVKDVVDALITDNSNRPTYRIIRYLNDTAASGTWTPISTYTVTPTNATIELVENNLRFVKLKLPIADGVTWGGNNYIQTTSESSTVQYLKGWDYVYDKFEQAFTVWNNLNIPNTVTVNQRDETLGTPTDANFYSERNFSKEVFGKGIGLIYKEFLHWEYQPPSSSNHGYTGYGIKLTMIDHN